MLLNYILLYCCTTRGTARVTTRRGADSFGRALDAIDMLACSPHMYMYHDILYLVSVFPLRGEVVKDFVLRVHALLVALLVVLLVVVLVVVLLVLVFALHSVQPAQHP